VLAVHRYGHDADFAAALVVVAVAMWMNCCRVKSVSAVDDHDLGCRWSFARPAFVFGST